jgi:hypothetical protein
MKCCEATFERSGRGGQFGEIFRPEHLAGLTTPSAPLRWLRDFSLRAQPPLLFQGGEKPEVKLLWRSDPHRPRLQHASDLTAFSFLPSKFNAPRSAA